ncbi:MAG: leucine-rich repeat protein [Prevotella sp.]|nr:leucine-rich repeat protein [Candidatus Equicola faecalis]
MKLILLCLFCMVSLGASAFEVDGIYYNITSSSSPYTVEVTNNNNLGTYSGVVNIPSSVAYNGKTYSVTSIGSYAFADCFGLKSIEIPNSVISIRESAFYHCSGLTSVEIPNSVTSIGNYAFSDCSGLTSVTIGNSVTRIGIQAFACCSGLTSITIGNSVASIGSMAFFECSGLTSVNITDLDKWVEIEFGGSDANPLFHAHNLYLNGQHVTDAKLTTAKKIGSYAFHDYSILTSVTIPNSVTSIGDYAFHNCFILGFTISPPPTITLFREF